MIFLILVAGCISTATETATAPKDTPTPHPTPIGVTYCDIDPGDLCLAGIGLEGEDKMLLLFKADDRVYAKIKILLKQSEGEDYLVCLQSLAFPENVYCQGQAVPDGEKIELQIYTLPDGNLRAASSFIVQYGFIQAPDVDFKLTPKTIPESTTGPASPTPATPEPEYPNPSYPN